MRVAVNITIEKNKEAQFLNIPISKNIDLK